MRKLQPILITCFLALVASMPATAETPIDKCIAEYKGLEAAISSAVLKVEDKNRLQALHYTGLHYCRLGNTSVSDNRSRLIRLSLS